MHTAKAKVVHIDPVMEGSREGEIKPGRVRDERGIQQTDVFQGEVRRDGDRGGVATEKSIRANHGTDDQGDIGADLGEREKRKNVKRVLWY